VESPVPELAGIASLEAASTQPPLAGPGSASESDGIPSSHEHGSENRSHSTLFYRLPPSLPVDMHMRWSELISRRQQLLTPPVDVACGRRTCDSDRSEHLLACGFRCCHLAATLFPQYSSTFDRLARHVRAVVEVFRERTVSCRRRFSCNTSHTTVCVLVETSAGPPRRLTSVAISTVAVLSPPCQGAPSSLILSTIPQNYLGLAMCKNQKRVERERAWFPHGMRTRPTILLSPRIIHPTSVHQSTDYRK
jgi:hypothetical protein